MTSGSPEYLGAPRKCPEQGCPGINELRRGESPAGAIGEMLMLHGQQPTRSEPSEPREDGILQVVLNEALNLPDNPQRRRDYDHAVSELQATAHFKPDHLVGPFILHLSVSGNDRFVFDVRDSQDQPLHAYMISLSPFRSLIRDYNLMIESFEMAINDSNSMRMQAVDMGRRGVHNDAADLLVERLKGKIDVSQPTARALFTLIHSLAQRG